MNKPDTNLVDRRRAASLLLAFTFAALSAQAQTSGATVDSLASDLAALTARVAKLEGQIAAADLAGTYAIHGIQIELGSGGGTSPEVSSYVIVGTLVLAADGTGSLTAMPPNGNTLSIFPQASVSPFMGSGGGGTMSFTWTYANGVVTAPGGLPPFSVVASGQILITASTNNSDGTDVLLILTRLPPAS